MNDIERIAQRVVAGFGYAGTVVKSERLDSGEIAITVSHRTLEGPTVLTTVTCDQTGRMIERTTK